jgi:hypothetical protein
MRPRSALCPRDAGFVENQSLVSSRRVIYAGWGANQLDRLIKFDRGMACERARMLESRVRLEPDFTKPSNMIGAFKTRRKNILVPFFRKI